MTSENREDALQPPAGPAAALFSPKRFAIASLLYLRGSMSMARLRELTGLSWGDLDSNVRFLARRGLAATRKVFTRRGVRTMVYLTEEGRRAYEELVDYLSGILASREG